MGTKTQPRPPTPLQAVLEQTEPVELNVSLLGNEDGPPPDFKIFTGSLHIEKSSTDTDGRKRVRGIASSSVKDLHGDTMTDHCVRSMAKQAVGKTIFLNHSYKMPEDIFGVVEKARTKTMSAAEAKGLGLIDKSASNDPITLLDITVIEDPSNDRAEKLFSSMENGITVGISIGAMITDYEEDPEYTGDWWPPLIINDVDLLEASMVGIPANPLSWVENATKGLILKGAIKGANETMYNRARQRGILAASAGEESTVDPEDETAAAAEAEVVAETPEPETIEQAFDGPDQIIAFYQMGIEAGTVSKTDLDAMEDAIQASIDKAIEQGVDKAVFAERTAKDLAQEILSSEPAPEAPDTAEELASPESDDQEALPESDPETGDAGDEDAETKAAAEISALQEAGALDGLAKALTVLGDTLKALIAERKKSTDFEAEVIELRARLTVADANVAASVQFVNKVMELPMNRKAVVRRAAQGFAEKLQDSPYGAELLTFIARHTQGASDAP